jgi:hypothetical protein
VRGVDNQMIGRGDRGFVARDYWVWLIFEGLQNLVEKVEKKSCLFKGFAVVSGLLISFQHQWLVFRPDAWSNEPRSRGVCYLGLVMDDSMEACLLCIRGDFCNSATTPAHPCRWGLPTLSPWPIACVVSLRRGGFLVMPSVKACGNAGLTCIFWWCFSGSFAG